jgi:hypothetical protein
VVTGWKRIGRGGEDKGRKCMSRGRKSTWEREPWIVLCEKEGK